MASVTNQRLWTKNLLAKFCRWGGEGQRVKILFKLEAFVGYGKHPVESCKKLEQRKIEYKAEMTLFKQLMPAKTNC